jgi:MoaA/NifB/PqqE/SkfB family radical SAM enzyme
MVSVESANALVFKPTRACPARCDFCCDPHEASQDRLQRSDMIGLVDRVAQELPGIIGTVGFTGGEPFLRFDDMRAVLARARASGMAGAVVSSSYWASSPALALARLGILAEAGLRRYSTSCDSEHLRFVPLAHIRQAVTAAIELGLEVTVTGTFSGIGERVAPLLGEDLAALVICEEKLIAPFGRASGKAATVTHYGLRSDPAQWRCYRRLGHDILVQPNGDVLPCCATNNTINPLVFGNVTGGRRHCRNRAQHYPFLPAAGAEIRAFCPAARTGDAACAATRVARSRSGLRALRLLCPGFRGRPAYRCHYRRAGS